MLQTPTPQSDVSSIESSANHKKHSNRNSASIEYSLHAKLSFNVCMVGKKGSGKTSLILREVKDYFGKLPNNSAGFEFYSKNYQRSGDQFSFQIWDTVLSYIQTQAGSSQYKSMTRNFFRKASCIVLVFHEIEKLQLQIQSLTEELKQYADKSIKLCLVRSKMDLINQTQQSSQLGPEETADDESIKEIINKFKIFHYGEVSSKNGTNVHNFFQSLVEKIYKAYEEDQNFRNFVEPKGDSFVLSTLTSATHRFDKFEKRTKTQNKRSNCC